MRPLISAGLLAAGLALFGSLEAQPAPPASPLAGLDDYVERVRHAWRVPGIAVGIVKGDSLVYAKGFGVKRLGEPAAVTPETIFAIGSNTKSFTVTVLAMLVDDGVVRWNDRVTKWLPGFQLHDPYVTRELTVRDVLSHRAGLGRRGDALWYGTPYSRAEILERIRHLTPNAGFRTEMGYQNVMFLAAGEVAGRAAGMSYDEVVRRRIFEPLGMRNSSTSVKGLPGQSDVSTPHSIGADSVAVIPWRDIDNIAPAGSINSSIVEMAQYLRLHLGNGTVKGKRLVSATNLGVTKTPHVNTGGVGDSLTHFSSYGLGWVLLDYRGKKIAWHNGGIDGMLSEMWTVPEAGLGIVVLTNGSPHSAGPAVVWEIVDRFLVGKAAKDYLAQGLEQMKRIGEAQAAQAKQRETARVKDTRPSLGLEAYAGTFTDALYGDLSVRVEGTGLVVQYGGNRGPVDHWHYNTFRGREGGGLGAFSFLTFQVDARGRASSVDVEGLGSFRR
ncbi:MAG: serine hydrolase [Gemmatimonadetes bacterium]|nr:serine hydrolase [Gemmatimonadota bacterium]